MQAETMEARWRRRAYRVWTTVGILVLLAAAGWLLGKLSLALVPFVMALILVFVLAWPVRAMETRGIGRSVGAALAVASLVLAVALAITFFAPPLVRQLADLVRNVPNYLRDIEHQVASVERSVRAVALPPWLRNLLLSAAGSAAATISTWGTKVATWIVASSGSALTLLIDLFVSLVLAYWFLRDLPTLRREVDVLAGDKYADDVDMLLDQITRSMGGYLRGQTVASLCTGLIAMVGLAIAGVPYAFLLGVLAFVLNYIPYVGPFVTALVAGTVALFSGGAGVEPIKALIAVGIVIAAQQITDNLVTPRVMSAEVALHPTLVIFSLLVGGTLFGIPGMLFAIPIAAAIQGAFVYYFERATRTELATTEGAFFVKADDDDLSPPTPSEPPVTPVENGDTV